MNRIISLITILLLLSIICPSLLFAQSAEEKRAIEETKRESLRSSEVQAAKEELPPAAPLAPIDLIYFAELSLKKISFRYDACKAFVLLLGVEDEYIDLAAQVAFLQQNNLLPKKYRVEFDPMQPLRRGLLAYMFCQALEIKGGITLRVFGTSQRYALQELAFEGIMASGNVNDIVSGDELVSATTQAANYLAQKEAAARARADKIRP